MSASEKLKALDQRLIAASGSSYWDNDLARVESALSRALPQIVAVVEAAEKLARHFSLTASEWNQAQRDVDAALTALEEALL